MRPLTLLCCLTLTGCASQAPEIGVRSALPAASIPVKVLKPDGPGPFPAIVMLHDCSGLGPRSSGAPARWGALLQRQGYVIVIPDSFSTRGFPDGVCTNPSPARNEVAPGRRVADAFEALAYARALPYVDGAHVGVMGGSHGGSTTLATLVALQRGFAAGIALYPGCGFRYGDWRPGTAGVYKPAGPLLILVGEKDDWTPAEPCRQLVKRSHDAGLPVEIKVYPGAHHSFDSDRPVRFVQERVNANAPGGRGATTGGDPQAWADSVREVTAFFDRHLRDSRAR
jgi:dienelactone hydrolase